MDSMQHSLHRTLLWAALLYRGAADLGHRLKDRLCGLSFWQLAALLVLFCLLLECFVFNARFWTFSEEAYPRTVINLPQSAGGAGMLLDPAKPEITVDNLNLPVRTVKMITASSRGQILSVMVKICDASSYYQPQPANLFLLNPGGNYHSRLFYLDPRGPVNKLQLTIMTSFSDLRLTSLVLNEPPDFEFSSLRWLLLSALAVLMLAILRFKVYQLTVVYSESRLFKYCSRCVLALSLLLSFGYFCLTAPPFTEPIAYDVLGENCVDLTTDKHELLKALPENLAELQRCDPFVQLLSAMRHGQINMEFPWDPKINTLKNPNDPTERARAGVKEYFDMQTYENKYYIPHGLAPLIVAYLPVWFLTGRMPAPALANILCALPAVLALYLALQMMLRTLVVRGNLLLTVAVQFALICCSGVYMQQTAIAHYGLTAICGVTFLSFWLAGVYALPLCRTQRSLRWVLFAAGAAVPFIVHSRPHLTFLAILLGTPYLLWFIYGRFKALGIKTALIDLGTVSLPVAIGAMLIMSWNYARYSNPFEFGQFANGFSLSDFHFHPELSMGHLLALWWYYIFEPLTWVREFPFVLSSTHGYVDQGRMIFLTHRVSLLAFPLMWGMFLIFFRRPKAVLKPCLIDCSTLHGSALGTGNSIPAISFVLTLLYLPYMCYFMLYGGGVVCARYYLDFATAYGLIASVLIALNLRWENSVQSRICYCLAMFLVCKSALIGLLLPFDFDEYHILKQANPDAFIGLGQLLQPFSY